MDSGVYLRGSRKSKGQKAAFSARLQKETVFTKIVAQVTRVHILDYKSTTFATFAALAPPPPPPPPRSLLALALAPRTNRGKTYTVLPVIYEKVLFQVNHKVPLQGVVKAPTFPRSVELYLFGATTSAHTWCPPASPALQCNFSDVFPKSDSNVHAGSAPSMCHNVMHQMFNGGPA